MVRYCSGPDRPGSYKQHLARLGIDCKDFDICRDEPNMDLTADDTWSALTRDMDNGKITGALMGPQCPTFSCVRRLPGGPKPVRDLDCPGI